MEPWMAWSIIFVLCALAVVSMGIQPDPYVEADKMDNRMKRKRKQDEKKDSSIT